MNRVTYETRQDYDTATKYRDRVINALFDLVIVLGILIPIDQKYLIVIMMVSYFAVKIAIHIYGLGSLRGNDE